MSGKLLGLAKRTRLDLAVMLAISVYYDVPRAILQDALSLLLKMDLDDKDVEHIGLLPRYGRALLSLALRSIALEEAVASSRDDSNIKDSGEDEDKEVFMQSQQSTPNRI